jgi:hypothetical protein
MHRLTASLICLLSVAAGAEEFHRMKKVELMDAHGFEKPIPAISMLIPSDWKFESNVIYGQAGCGELLQLTFRATSPDQLNAIELFPAYSWQWADDPQMRQSLAAQNQQQQKFKQRGCDLMQPTHAVDFVGKVMAPKVRPNSRVLKNDPVPETEAAVQKQAQQLQQQAQQYGTRQRVYMDTARVRIGYDLKGSKVEEWLTAVVTTRQSVMPSMRGQSSNYNASARLLFGMRAPAGKLDAQEKLFKAIIASMQIQPAWQARVGQVQQNIAATRAKGEADRARIRAQSAEDVRKIQNDSIRNQQHAQDVQHQQFSQYIRDVESYRDPNTGQQVELSNQYGHAWSNGAGEYILSDSPNFNPNAHVNGSWTQMEQVKPQ